MSMLFEDSGPKRLTDREAVERLRTVCGSDGVRDIGGWTEQRRNAAMAKVIRAGISIRQLSRLTGISKAVVERIARR